MRNIKKLIPIVIDSLKNGHKSGWYNNGICGEIVNLHDDGKITFAEQSLLLLFLNDNKPSTSKHSEFTNSHFWIGSVFWWRKMQVFPETRQIRIDFLTMLLNQN